MNKKKKLQVLFVDKAEMKEILSNKKLLKSISNELKDTKKMRGIFI